jgi:glycerophosphoryl diester phosphodiesterase
LSTAVALGPGADPAAAASAPLQVVAHRGDMADDPESTLDAFGDAIAKGAIEFDLRITKDGSAVAMHDDTVDRTTDGSHCTGLVSKLTWAQPSMCDAGSWFGYAFKSQHVPRLTDALAYISQHSKTVKIYLHIKPRITQAQADHIVAVVKKYGLNTNRVTYVGENETC